MPVRSHFLPWDKPLLSQAVEWLAAGWNGEGPLDLSRSLVVVPTQQSGRRLREALAARAQSRGQAVFSPRVATPDLLIEPPAGVPPATRSEALVAWAEVLRSADLGEFREVFPRDPPVRSFAWAARIGERLIAVQRDLAEGGLRLADVAAKAGEAFAETERWRKLAELERRYDERLRAWNRVDPQKAKIEAAGNPAPLESIDRIVLLGTPDPLPLALKALAAHARAVAVEIVVYGPKEAGFDAWGAPAAADWNKRDLPFERVRLSSDPTEQAKTLAELASSYGGTEGRLAVGVVDPEIKPLLESALRRAKIEVFDPEGCSRRSGELHPVLAALADLVRDPTFEAVEALGRCPAFLDFLRTLISPFSTSGWLEGLDELRAEHLPPNLASARVHAAGLSGRPELARGIEAIETLREAAASFEKGALEAPARLFEGRQLDPRRPADARLMAEAIAWSGAVRACTAAFSAATGDIPAAEAWDFALRLYAEGREDTDKAPGAVELQGWLELLWEDAPHLAVAGLNDGRVPEAVAGDAFLPESLRAKLGLKTNAERFARDAYILRAIAAARESTGRLDLLLGKTSIAGEPLRPSRLLLRCGDAELPGRVAALFGSPPASAAPPAWTRAWRLEPPRADPPTRVRATALRDWLDCPFRFYLKHVLNMEAVEAGRSELDALAFGTLCHGVLEVMARDPEWADCTDPVRLRNFVVDELDRRVLARFGTVLTLPVAIQRDAARQRLGRAAEIQAAERADGWRIVEVERPIEASVAGLLVRGKIDRVDRHERSGAVRVLDYKTSDKPAGPQDAHLRKKKSAEKPPDWASLRVGGKPHVWVDLQLPFYLRAVGDAYPGAVAGYFNLPAAVGEAGISLWEDYGGLRESAGRCLEGVCGAIARGEFWPPKEKPERERDEFEALFRNGAEASVHWEEAGR